MAGAENILNTACKWETQTLTVTTSSQLVAPVSLREVTTMMIQSASTNGGLIYFGEDSSLSSSDAGGELAAGMSATLPLSNNTSSKLYVKGSTGSQTLYVSLFNRGEVF